MAGQSSILVDPGSITNHLTWQRTDGTRTGEVDKHVLDEAFQPTYIVVGSTPLAISTGNSHVVQVMAGASNKVGIQTISVTQVANANAIALTQWRLFRLTSAGTGGTALTPALFDTADGASGFTAMTLPSAKGTESTQLSEKRGLIHTTATTIGVAGVPIVTWDFRHLRGKALWIAAGTSNGIAVKNVSSDTTATVIFEVVAIELPYSL